MSADESELFEAWLEPKPQRVKDAARVYPPWQCYRNDGRGHYIIQAYGEPINDEHAPCTVTLLHGADSFLPGVGVFGVPLSSLTVCGCGKWEWPTQEQADESETKIAAFAAVEAALRAAEDAAGGDR